MSIILASQSPRRQELLQRLVSDFQTIVPAIDETVRGQATPESYVLEMAQRKAQQVFKDHHDSLVIGSDTIVTFEGAILGKPQDDEDARQMLQQLSGGTHQVMTSVYMMNAAQIEQQVLTTDVTFFDLTAAEIDAYLATGEHRDKAGAYGIQGAASLFVKEINGDYYTVVGFPVAHAQRMLAKFN